MRARANATLKFQHRRGRAGCRYTTLLPRAVRTVQHHNGTKRGTWNTAFTFYRVGGTLQSFTWAMCVRERERKREICCDFLFVVYQY